MTFDVIPAIDLRGGRVVRLARGDFAAETVYGADPAGVARAFVGAGARRVHIVDLDGARAGRPVQLEVARSIVHAAMPDVECEIAGGLRSRADVEAAFEAGASRVVLGSAALTDIDLVQALVDDHGSAALVVALDVRGGRAVGDGWRSDAPSAPAREAMERLADVGVREFEVTAIERDGLLGGPDLELLAELVAADFGSVIASAGIASVDDLVATRDIGCGGAIVGRALYEGWIDLRTAILALDG